MREEFKTQDSTLDWKRHDEFFKSLNVKLDQISEVGEACYRDLNYIFDYYAKVKNLFNKHKSYIAESKKVKLKLLNIEKAIYNKRFLNDLKEQVIGAKEYQLTLFNALQDIYIEINENFPRSELIPKPRDIDKPMSKNDEISEDEREEYEALEEIGIKYKIIN